MSSSRPTRRAPVAVSVVAALGLALAACGDDSGSSASATDATAAGSVVSSPTTEAKGQPKPGGNLTFALAADPTCVDPQQAGANAALNVGRQVVDSLTDQDGETGEIKPWLAESFSANDTATSFTFKLRSGVTFSDGAAVDAAAVKANFDAIVALGAKAPLGSSYLAGYVGTTVVDPLTVRVDFSAPSAQFLQASSTMSLGLESPASLGKDPGERCQGAVVGSGPFVIKSYVVNQEVTITKRAGYQWGSSLFGHQGEAYLDGVTYKIIPEPGVRLGSLQSDQLDAISDVQPQDEPQFEDPATDFSLLVRGNPGLPFGFHANASRPALAEEAVRVAFSKAINRQEVNETVLTPAYKAATSVLASSTPGYADQSAALAYDPDGAKALLDGAGWTPGPDGIRQKDGSKLSLVVIFNPLFNATPTVLELVQQEVKAVGIDLQLKQLTPAETNPAINAGDYDYVFYNLTRVDPDLLRTVFSSKGTNRTRLVDPELDALLDKQAATLDPAARNAALAQAQARVIAEGYFAPVFELAQVHGLSPAVQGLHFEASSRLSFYDTWLDK